MATEGIVRHNFYYIASDGGDLSNRSDYGYAVDDYTEEMLARATVGYNLYFKWFIKEQNANQMTTTINWDLVFEKIGNNDKLKNACQIACDKVKVVATDDFKNTTIKLASGANSIEVNSNVGGFTRHGTTVLNHTWNSQFELTIDMTAAYPRFYVTAAGKDTIIKDSTLYQYTPIISKATGQSIDPATWSSDSLKSKKITADGSTFSQVDIGAVYSTLYDIMSSAYDSVKPIEWGWEHASKATVKKTMYSRKVTSSLSSEIASAVKSKNGVTVTKGHVDYAKNKDELDRYKAASVSDPKSTVANYALIKNKPYTTVVTTASETKKYTYNKEVSKGTKGAKQNSSTKKWYVEKKASVTYDVTYYTVYELVLTSAGKSDNTAWIAWQAFQWWYAFVKQICSSSSYAGKQNLAFDRLNKTTDTKVYDIGNKKTVTQAIPSFKIGSVDFMEDKYNTEATAKNATDNAKYRAVRTYFYTMLSTVYSKDSSLTKDVNNPNMTIKKIFNLTSGNGQNNVFPTTLLSTDNLKYFKTLVNDGGYVGDGLADNIVTNLRARLEGYYGYGVNGTYKTLVTRSGDAAWSNKTAFIIDPLPDEETLFSGSIHGTVNFGKVDGSTLGEERQYEFQWRVASQDINTRKSVLNWTFRVSPDPYAKKPGEAFKGLSIVIGGVECANTSQLPKNDKNAWLGTSDDFSMSGSLPITHLADGTKSVTVKITGYVTRVHEVY